LGRVACKKFLEKVHEGVSFMKRVELHPTRI